MEIFFGGASELRLLSRSSSKRALGELMVAGRVGKRARVPFFVADTGRLGRREGSLLDINVESIEVDG